MKKISQEYVNTMLFIIAKKCLEVGKERTGFSRPIEEKIAGETLIAFGHALNRATSHTNTDTDKGKEE